MTPRRHAHLGGALLVALAGCRGCGRAPAPPDAGPPPFEPPRAIAPAPTSWVFNAARAARSLALPLGCKLARPPLEADVGERTRFTADPTTIGAVIVGEANEAGDGLARAGILTFGQVFEPKGALPVPWHAPEAMPRVARDRAAGGWVLAVEQPFTEKLSELALWREGGAAERVAIGAGLEAVDLLCERDLDGAGPGCAVLATRLGEAERPGADVWISLAGGKPTRVELPAASVDTDLAPLRFARARWEEAKAGPPGQVSALAPAPVLAAVRERGEVAFFAVGPTGAVPRGRVALRHGFLAAAVLEKEPHALVLEDPLNAQGCAAPAGRPPAIRLERPGGGDGALLSVLTAPERAALVPLPHMALVLTLERTGCDAERRVLHATSLSAGGAPLPDTRIPIGDADAFAVSAEGPIVDLWLLNGKVATLARLRCD